VEWLHFNGHLGLLSIDPNLTDRERLFLRVLIIGCHDLDIRELQRHCTVDVKKAPQKERAAFVILIKSLANTHKA
jgi:hypothetical protein